MKYKNRFIFRNDIFFSYRIARKVWYSYRYFKKRGIATPQYEFFFGNMRKLMNDVRKRLILSKRIDSLLLISVYSFSNIRIVYATGLISMAKHMGNSLNHLLLKVAEKRDPRKKYSHILYAEVILRVIYQLLLHLTWTSSIGVHQTSVQFLG